ncbi:MAG: hypothetical protein ACJ8F3_14930 [Xanthobacteraceae bacterium]
MTAAQERHGSLGTPARWHGDHQRLSVRLADVLVALLSCGLSLGVLTYTMSALARAPLVLSLHLAVLAIPLTLWVIRARHRGELTFAVLLTIGTAVSGPIGAFGCAVMGLTLWLQQPSPTRLQEWYDYIAGVVARGALTSLYDELISGRLPSDPTTQVPRFQPILHGASADEQQRALAVMGRRYHPDFRAALRSALRNKNVFIRAQAAAVAARLDADEKLQLWIPAQAQAATEALPPFERGGVQRQARKGADIAH